MYMSSAPDRRMPVTKVLMAFITLIAAVALMGFAANSAKAADFPVVAESAPGVPCPPLVGTGGGCTVQVIGSGIVLSVDGIPRASCENAFDVHIGPTGTTWITNITITGDFPCDEITACNVDGSPLPAVWHDQIVWRDPPGVYIDTIDLCLNTPLGQFSGPLDVELDVTGPNDEVIGVTANNAQIGSTSATITGSWVVIPNPDSVFLTH